jgi:hypothetical protein
MQSAKTRTGGELMLLLSFGSSQHAHSEHLGITVYRLRHSQFDQVAVFMDRVSIFIGLGIIQRNRKIANTTNGSLEGRQGVVVHLVPSGTEQIY